MILHPFEHSYRRSSCQHEEEVRALSAHVLPEGRAMSLAPLLVQRHVPMLRPYEVSTVCRHRPALHHDGDREMPSFSIL